MVFFKASCRMLTYVATSASVMGEICRDTFAVVKLRKNDYGLTSLTEIDELWSGDDSQDGNVAWKSVSYD
jgi:hypothetical protein